MKTKTLTEIRYFPAGSTFSRPVGFKHRLLPAATARRIAKRLRKSGVNVTLASHRVTLTGKERHYLLTRYGV
jgi:hypothetical protein